MIFIVDDDNSVAELVREALSAAGQTVMTFDNAAGMLQSAADQEPELIISDVMMPEMDGFELKEAYSDKYPNRQTPFIFLSSLSDASSIVRGLDLGADDFLVKPVNPDVLNAKARSVLNRKKRYSVPVFYGDLARLPFVKLLQFCEMKGLTGEIEITNSTKCIKLQLKGGNLILDNFDDSILEELYDQAEGAFIISSYPTDFKEIEDASARIIKKPVQAMAEKEKPMGKLSGVKANNMLFQLQTEFVTFPENTIVTIVILDGRVLMKRQKKALPDSSDRKLLEKMIEEQHSAVENEVREKINDLVKKKTDDADSPKEKFNRLFEDGFDKYRDGNYKEALRIWEEAFSLNHADKILETNLGMLRKKMKLDSR
jgi:DNA-binding response OmpR family regulator